MGKCGRGRELGETRTSFIETHAADDAGEVHSGSVAHVDIQLRQFAGGEHVGHDEADEEGDRDGHGQGVEVEQQDLAVRASDLEEV